MKNPFKRIPIATQPTQYMDMSSYDDAEEKVVMPTWMFNPPYGLGRLMRNGEVFNAREMRLLGGSTTVWQCKKKIADAVIAAKWDILPTNPQKRNEEKIREIRQFLQLAARPNVQNYETFNSIIFSTVMDLLDLDAGVIVKVFSKTLKNRLVRIHSRDGSTIIKQTDPYGILKQYWQYDYASMIEPIALMPKEIAYLLLNPRSDSVYGESPVETIVMVVKGLVKGIQTHEMMYRKGGIPSGILALEGMNQQDFTAFKAWWETNIKNKVYQRTMINVPTKWVPLITSFRDLQFLETQQWFTEIVYRTFKVPHRGIGAATREAKGIPEEETRSFYKETIIPILTTLEQVLNQQIIPHFYDSGQEPDCYFHYTLIDLLEETSKMELWQKKWDYGAATVNEYRLSESLEKLPWGDLNPQAMKNLQNIAQSWWYGAFDSDAFKNITGIPVPSKEEIRKLLTKPTPTTETQE